MIGSSMKCFEGMAIYKTAGAFKTMVSSSTQDPRLWAEGPKFSNFGVRVLRV